MARGKEYIFWPLVVVVSVSIWLCRASFAEGFWDSLSSTNGRGAELESSGLQTEISGNQLNLRSTFLWSEVFALATQDSLLAVGTENGLIVATLEPDTSLRELDRVQFARIYRVTILDSFVITSDNQGYVRVFKFDSLGRLQMQGELKALITGLFTVQGSAFVVWPSNYPERPKISRLDLSQETSPFLDSAMEIPIEKSPPISDFDVVDSTVFLAHGTGFTIMNFDSHGEFQVVSQKLTQVWTYAISSDGKFVATCDIPVLVAPIYDHYIRTYDVSLLDSILPIDTFYFSATTSRVRLSRESNAGIVATGYEGVRSLAIDSMGFVVSSDCINTLGTGIAAQTRISRLQGLAVTGSLLFGEPPFPIPECEAPPDSAQLDSFPSQGDVLVYDYTPPESTHIVAHFPTHYHPVDVTVAGNLGFSTNGITKVLVVLDITNVDNPKILSETKLAFPPRESLYNPPYLYVAGGGYGVETFDMSNPAKPKRKGTVSLPNAERLVRRDNNFMYVTMGSAGMSTLYIGNPAYPTLASIEPAPAGGRTVDVAAIGTLVYVANDISDLRILDASNPYDPEPLFDISTSLYSVDLVEIEDSIMYLASNLQPFVEIYSVFDPFSPLLITEYVAQTTYISDIEADGSAVFVTRAHEPVSGFESFSSEDPANPLLLTNNSIPGIAISVSLSDENVFISGASGLQIFKREFATAVNEPGDGEYSFQTTLSVFVSPNPFNASTRLSITIPRASWLSVSIYNLLGRKIRTLADYSADSGVHTMIWNGKSEDGVSVASGVYFCKVDTNVGSVTKKLTLLK